MLAIASIFNHTEHYCKKAFKTSWEVSLDLPSLGEDMNVHLSLHG